MELSSSTFVFLGVFWFIGLFIGWFFRRGISFWGIVVVIVCTPAFNIVIDIDWWPLTLAFFSGLFIHTWKPLYMRLQQL